MHRGVKRGLLALGVVAVVGGAWMILTAGLHAAVRSGIETVGGEATATRRAVGDVRVQFNTLKRMASRSSILPAGAAET